jgi:hypothetical protein
MSVPTLYEAYQTIAEQLETDVAETWGCAVHRDPPETESAPLAPAAFVYAEGISVEYETPVTDRITILAMLAGVFARPESDSWVFDAVQKASDLRDAVNTPRYAEIGYRPLVQGVKWERLDQQRYMVQLEFRVQATVTRS